MFTGASMPKKRAVATIVRGNAANTARAKQTKSQDRAYFSSRLLRRIMFTMAARDTASASRIVT